MDPTAYIARQPILDRKGQLFAFELLFRHSKKSETASVQNGVTATASVIENAMNGVGLLKLLGTVKGFINCNRETIVGPLPSLLNPNWFVLEILEDVEPDETVVNAVAALRRKGFELALDDFVFTTDNCEKFALLFPYVSYVKIDLIENTVAQRNAAVSFFKERHIALLAEKVETEEEFKVCVNAGYDYFQGYFFAKPEVVAGNSIPASASAILQLMRDLRYEPKLEDFAKDFSRFPEVENALLRYAEESRHIKRTPVTTVKTALEWIGLRNVHAWLMLMLYSRSLACATAFQSPLFTSVSHRAKFMENLALEIAPNHPNFFADAFIVGVLSRIDAFVDVPVSEALNKIVIAPEVREAITERNGPLGTLLRLADAVEADNRDELDVCMHKLFVTPQMLQRSLQSAFDWVNYV